jgi:hypothetical protein
LSRRLLLVISAGALAAAGLFTSGAAKATTAASGAPAGGECQLQGTANFSPPGLTTSSSSFTYGFTGSLSGCQSNNNAPGSGTVSAGSPITISGVTYQEPAASGTGSCSNSSTKGISVTQWADGDYTVVSYTTTGAAAAVQLQGSVIGSVTVTGTNSSGQPISATVTTNEPSTPVGASAVGELTFSTSSPTGVTACNSGGLTQAVINGFIEIGQQ